MKNLKFVVALVGFAFCSATIVETSAEIVIPAKKIQANMVVVSSAKKVSKEIVIPAKKIKSGITTFEIVIPAKK